MPHRDVVAVYSGSATGKVSSLAVALTQTPLLLFGLPATPMCAADVDVVRSSILWIMKTLIAAMAALPTLRSACSRPGL